MSASIKIAMTNYRLGTLIIILFLQIGVFAQEETVIDHKGTLVQLRNNVVTTATTAPLAPLQNDIWFDTTTELTKIYDGTAWLTINLDALAKKEDSSNKSSDTNLSDATNTKFPTELAVKTYVDGQLLASLDDDITGVSFDGASLKVDEGLTTFSADLSALEESADIAANTTAIAAHNTADGDLSSANEIQTLTISGSDLSITGMGGNTVSLPLVTGTPGSLFFADTDGTATEDNGQIFWDATNNRLGVGTNSPSHKLQVSGQVRATSFANADGTASAPSYRFNSDGNTGMFRAAADQLGLSTGGNEALRIDSSSKVGIGTANPNAQLDIESTGVPLRIQPSTTTPTGTEAGQIFMDTDGMLYAYDASRSKWLSVDRTNISWTRGSNFTTNDYLRTHDSSSSLNNGYRMIRNATITSLAAQTNTTESWNLLILKNDGVTSITFLTMTSQSGNHANNINIDVNEGDFIQAYCLGTNISHPLASIEFAWRK